jgi:anti-anti-sigma factor
MALEIKVIRKKDSVYSLKLKGSLDSDTHQKLEEEIKKLIDQNTRVIILDMAAVTYISSAGVRVILWIEKTLKQRHASFTMVRLQPQIKKVLNIMKILPMFEIFDDMSEADHYIDQIIKEEIGK